MARNSTTFAKILIVSIVIGITFVPYIDGSTDAPDPFIGLWERPVEGYEAYVSIEKIGNYYRVIHYSDNITSCFSGVGYLDTDTNRIRITLPSRTMRIRQYSDEYSFELPEQSIELVVSSYGTLYIFWSVEYDIYDTYKKLSL